MRKLFFVRCPREGMDLGQSMSSGLPVIIPDGMTYEQAVEFACELVSTEFRRYIVHECLRGLGMKQEGEA